MMRLLLTAVLLMVVNVSMAKKHALIIAVGDYPKSTGWSAISSVNDVPLIAETLKVQGFPEENIQILVNEQATREGILAAIATLQSKLESGDIVVVHYSGHGQQIFDTNNEEADGLDEALVPFDAWVRYTHNYQGENHLRDDELANIFAGIRNTLGKSGQLLVLLDSCHSGSATRGGKARGSAAAFVPDGWQPVTGVESGGSDMFEKVKLSTEAAPFVMLSGASANELNYEYNGSGSLSYSFAKAMSELGSGFTYRQLYAKIAAIMSRISPNQTPTIEGDSDYKLFKGEYVKQQPYFEIQRLLRSDVVRIQAGKIQGIFEGTTFSVLPSGSTSPEESKVITTGRVVKSKYNESNIILDTPLDSDSKQDYWLFIKDRTYGDMATGIFLDKDYLDAGLVSFLEEKLAESGFGNSAASKADSDLIVSVNDQGFPAIYITNGKVEIFNAENDQAGQKENILSHLFNYAQGSYLRDLNLDNLSYEFEFNLLPIAYDEVYDEFGEVNNEALQDSVTAIHTVVPDKDYRVLQVVNKSDRPLYFSIIEINSMGEITPFMPNANCDLNDNERLIPAGKTVIFKDCVFSFGPPYEKLILKGFASADPINFKPTVESKGGGTRGSSNPLEAFVQDTYVNSRGGSGRKVSAKVDGYTTEFVYEIVAEH